MKSPMRVRIYKPAKTAAQSGRGNTHAWLVEPELIAPRSPDCLMGWSGAGDAFSALRNRLRFPALDDAVAFAHKNGWEYYVDEPAEPRVVPRNYSDNFRIVRPEDEERIANGSRR